MSNIKIHFQTLGIKIKNCILVFLSNKELKINV